MILVESERRPFCVDIQSFQAKDALQISLSRSADPWQTPPRAGSSEDAQSASGKKDRIESCFDLPVAALERGGCAIALAAHRCERVRNRDRSCLATPQA
jgi:hypothetical protein